MPELPEARRKRMIAEYEITMQDAQTLTATRAFADQFETRQGRREARGGSPT
jgi:aspartyl-tRNA(Asn)/glutamyl-tRNA(Gln) amidotransferase subunit B